MTWKPDRRSHVQRLPQRLPRYVFCHASMHVHSRRSCKPAHLHTPVPVHLQQCMHTQSRTHAQPTACAHFNAHRMVSVVNYTVAHASWMFAFPYTHICTHYYTRTCLILDMLLYMHTQNTHTRTHTHAHARAHTFAYNFAHVCADEKSVGGVKAERDIQENESLPGLQLCWDNELFCMHVAPIMSKHLSIRLTVV